MKTRDLICRAVLVCIIAVGAMVALRCEAVANATIDLFFHNSTAQTTTFLWQRGSNEGWHQPVVVAQDQQAEVKTTEVGGSATTWFSLDVVVGSDTVERTYLTTIDWSKNGGVNIYWNGSGLTYTAIPR
jgi:hypothetical protein